MAAVQAALFLAGCPGGQVTRAMWGAFVAQHPRKTELTDQGGGVNKNQQVEFLRFARDEGVQFDFMAATQKHVHTSVPSLQVFHDETTTGLAPGAYVVHAGAAGGVEHCFAMQKSGDGAVQVVDSFDESKDPPCALEPLATMAWLQKVYSIRCIQPTDRPFKRRRKK